ncbi:hypothetical protein N0V90_007928 [Kalmusia sp. IMI 367209]|nr:hypothetical protein N0V90_007928 [Kalmusia sp. IMI 367209]
MATILDLPAELTEEIASYLLPCTVEAFAIACKAIFLKCPYRDDLFYFLRQITKDPLAAEYVQSISLWDRREKHEVMEARARLSEELALWKSDEIVEQVLEYAIDQVGVFLEETNIFSVDEWKSELRIELLNLHGQDQQLHSRPVLFNSATIFMLFPSLRVLKLNQSWSHTIRSRRGPSGRLKRRLIRLLDKLSDNAQEFTSERMDVAMKDSAVPPLQSKISNARHATATAHVPYRPLAKLEYLDPCFPNHNSGLMPSMAALDVFLRLPRLHTACVTSARTTPTWIPTRFPLYAVYDPFHSIHLRRLEMTYTWGTIESIAAMLGRCHSLEVFKYHSEGHQMEANDFVEAIANAVGRTLRELAIVGHFNRIPGDLAVTNLNEFILLEILEINVELFFLVKTGENDQHAECENPLGHILCPSIRKLVLSCAPCEANFRGVKVLCNGLSEDRNKRLKSLESMVVHSSLHKDGELGQEVQAIAEGQGVEWINVTPKELPKMGFLGDYEERFKGYMTYQDDLREDQTDW